MGGETCAPPPLAAGHLPHEWEEKKQEIFTATLSPTPWGKVPDRADRGGTGPSDKPEQRVFRLPLIFFVFI